MDSQFYTYRNNINRKDNDIFNRSLYNSKNSLLDTTNNTISTPQRGKRCRTPYDTRKENQEIDLKFATINPISNLTIDQNKQTLEVKKPNKNLNRSVTYREERFTPINNTKPYRYKDFELKKFKKENDNYHINNFSKYENKSIVDNKSESLICNNCYNKNLSELKKENSHQNKLNRDFDNSTLSFNDKLVNNFKNQVHERINNREKLTDLASRSIDRFRNNKKENLQIENELNSSILDKSVDYIRERAKSRSRFIESIIANNRDKFTPIDMRPEKMKYYKHYVDNYSNTSRDEPKLKHVNLNDLLYQINAKKEYEKEQKKREREEANRDAKKILAEFEEEQRQNSKKLKAMNNHFINANLKLIDDKKRREIMEREKDKKSIKESLQKTFEYIEEENKSNELKKSQMKLDFKRNLDIQIKENETRKKQDQINSKSPINDNKNPFRFSCGHGNSLYPCSICSKPYPKRMLSPNIFKRQISNYLNAD